MWTEKFDAFFELSLHFKIPRSVDGTNNQTVGESCVTFVNSWRISRDSAPIHWLVHGHMSSNNETVSRQCDERATLRKI